MNESAPYLNKHVLICTGDSCGPQNGVAVRNALKAELRARNIRQLYRDGECSCLGLCRDGVNAVIWPEGTYMAGVTVNDVPRLIDYLENKGAALSDLEVRADEKIAIKKGGK
ncbi:MAG: (2Fe-2S) ferredoxin domain-containing protein [Planctomycetota bacterium]